MQRLRQEKLGLMLKVFTELSALLQVLRNDSPEAAVDEIVNSSFPTM